MSAIFKFTAKFNSLSKWLVGWVNAARIGDQFPQSEADGAVNLQPLAGLRPFILKVKGKMLDLLLSQPTAPGNATGVIEVMGYFMNERR